MKHDSKLLAGLGLAIALACGPSVAQSPNPGSVTPEQVKMMRDEFLRTHEFDPATDNWVLKPGMTSAIGVRSTDQIKAARDQFLSTHVWSRTCGCWEAVPLGKKGKMTREQVRAETAQFTKTHQWDGVSDTWIDKK